MESIIKLNPTALSAIILPFDATEIHLGNHCIGFKSQQDHERDTNGWCIISLGLWANKRFEFAGTVETFMSHFDFKTETGLGTYDFYELLSENGIDFFKGAAFQKVVAILKPIS